MENMFSISFRKYRDKEKEKKLVYFDHQNVTFLCSRHHYCKVFLQFNSIEKTQR